MVALLRFFEHSEVVVEFLFGFERGAVNALELRILFVAFVVSARDVHELDRADVARPHHVRSGAKIDKVAAAIERDLFVLRNVFDDVDLVFARLIAIAERREPAFLSKLERLVPRNFHAFERVVRFDLLVHLGLDFFEIVWRNPVRKIDIVVEAVFDRRSGGKLRFRPNLQNRGRQYMRRRMTQTFEVGHRSALFWRFAFLNH